MLGFSVVIPLYNKEYIIGRCLKSLVEQTRLPDEVIVVDDGSTDNSLFLVESFKHKYPHLNISVISQENSGVSAARNKGVLSSRYDLVCFLDADDEWKPDFLALMEFLIKDYPDAVLYCLGHEVANAKSRVRLVQQGFPIGFRGYVDDFFKASSKGDVANSSKVCVRKNLFNKVGGFPEGIAAGEDLYLWCMLALIGSVAFENTSAVRINQLDDSSRLARQVITIPYPIVFFGNHRFLIKGEKNLKKYLTVLFAKHLLASIMQKKYKEAFARYWAFRKISYPKFFMFFIAFLIPPSLLRFKLRSLPK